MILEGRYTTILEGRDITILVIERGIVYGKTLGQRGRGYTHDISSVYRTANDVNCLTLCSSTGFRRERDPH